MKREEAIGVLQEQEAALQRLGVGHLYLFGSVARNEASTKSDIDIFFDLNDPKFSLLDLITVKERLEAFLATPVDVMTRGSLHPGLRSGIEASAVKVF
jgi:predicted nucleotidyltransferase